MFMFKQPPIFFYIYATKKEIEALIHYSVALQTDLCSIHR